MRSTLALFSVSRLEQGRVAEARPDLKDLGAFKELEETVTLSLSAGSDAGATRVVQPERTLSPLQAGIRSSRPLLDETLLQKLVQYRNQIPHSSRIIRAGDT
jgi:hypothetical protein